MSLKQPHGLDLTSRFQPFSLPLFKPDQSLSVVLIPRVPSPSFLLKPAHELHDQLAYALTPPPLLIFQLAYALTPPTLAHLLLRAFT